VAGLAVALLDAVGQLLLLVGAEEGRFIDFAQVRFQRRLDGRTSWPAWSCHDGSRANKPEQSSGFTIARVRAPANRSPGTAVHEMVDTPSRVRPPPAQLRAVEYRPSAQILWNPRFLPLPPVQFRCRTIAHDRANP